MPETVALVGRMPCSRVQGTVNSPAVLPAIFLDKEQCKTVAAKICWRHFGTIILVNNAGVVITAGGY